MTWNRDCEGTALEKSLDASQHCFRVTGEAALVAGSDDFAMFSPEGNLAVAAMVAQVQAALVEQPTEESAYLMIQGLYRGIGETHGEIHDTMVRETIAYALDGAWNTRFGHAVDQWEIPGD